MTLKLDNLLMEEEDPLMPAGWNEEQELEWRKHRELVRLQSVEEYSSCPLRQALAAKDPQYWNNFSVGQNFLHPPKS